MKNPFSKPADVARHLKIAVTGKAGTGKTVFGLDAKNHGMGPVAVLSNEAGDVHYIKHAKWGGFDRMPTQSLAALDGALDFLEENPGTYGTLVVDTVTGVYEGLVDAKSKEDGSVAMRDWGLIKRKWKSIMARLNNLPLSIVAVVHENDLVEVDAKGASKVVGQKLDAEKTFERNPDVLLRLGMHDGKRVGIVLKDRTGTFQAGQRVEEPHIGMWAKAIKGGGPEERIAPPEEVAKDNERAMATGDARPAGKPAPVEAPAAAAAPEPTTEGLLAFAVLLEAVEKHETFAHEAHMKNWWKKHATSIKQLTEAEQNVLRRALRAKTPELAGQNASAA